MSLGLLDAVANDRLPGERFDILLIDTLCGSDRSNLW